jgi:branched-chain amino acid transport system ATP-binding protein
MLSVEHLSAGYAGIKALRGVSLEVGAGEMVAVVGPNGAGKSTLLNCISGLLPATGGTVAIDGKRMTGLPAYAVSRAGLLQVPEGRQVLADLTVEDNLLLGELACVGRKSAYALSDVLKLFPRLEERLKQKSGTLSGGEQQMLAVGRALMGGPRVLLLDEPSLGLSPIMTDTVFSALRALNRDGLPILLVEQNAHLALESTVRAYVLDQGSVVHSGRSEVLAADDSIISHYLGQEPSLERSAVKAAGKG